MRRLPIALPLAVLALAAGASAADAELAFTPCPEPDQQGFECATLDVPLDRGGTVPGTVRLRVERLIQPVQPAGVLVNVEGGPGGSATWRAQQSRRLFAPLRDRYQLVLVDPRGIGLTEPELRCSPDAGRCARQLGDAARFYTTADNVADLEAVREALGAPRLFLYGTSYGTFVVNQYARTHPDRTERIVMDSPVPLDGIDPLGVETVHAIGPMLASLCADGACDAITRHPTADTAALVRRLRRAPARTRVVDPSGRPRRAALTASDVYEVLLAGDENAALRAFYPGAVRAALAGDPAPLARLETLGVERYTHRQVNPSIWAPTNCTDMRLPWPREAPPRRRRADLIAAIERVPAPRIYPMTRGLLGQSASAWPCLDWPATSLDRAITTAAPPPVPALVLSGLLDLRTPPADARDVAAAFPHGQLMAVPNRAHGVLRTDVACGQQALEAFVADRPVGNPCADSPPLLAIQPRPPRSRAGLPPAAGVPGRRGRTVAAVRATVADAIAVARADAPGGGAVAAGGLRAGSLRGARDAATGAVELTLRDLAYVPGVRVRGRVRADAAGVAGTVRVRARGASGRLTLAVDGSVRGRLGGRAVYGGAQR